MEVKINLLLLMNLIGNIILNAIMMKLKRLLLYFADVDLIDVKSINWKIRFDRNNQTYKMLVNICYLVINGLLQSEKSGYVKLMDFEDDQLMSSLYEKFLLNYFKKERDRNP